MGDMEELKNGWKKEQREIQDRSLQKIKQSVFGLDVG